MRRVFALILVLASLIAAGGTTASCGRGGGSPGSSGVPGY